MSLDACGLTSRGLTRATNQDAYLVEPELGLFAVADGLGGAAAGEVASSMTVAAVRAAFFDPEATWPGPAPPPAEQGVPLLVAAVARAHARVYAAASADRRKKGMGTTFTGLLVFGEQAAFAHAGESRLYRLRGGQLEQLTQDHTFVAECVRAGRMSEHEAATSDLRHQLTRAVGTRRELEVDARLLALEANDTFLLATDGLHAAVEEPHIRAIMRQDGDAARAAGRLIEAALDAGGPDNVTVVVVRVVRDHEPR